MSKKADARAENRRENYRRKSNFIDNVISSGLPAALRGLLLAIAKLMYSYCDHVVSWQSEGTLAKQLNCSERHVRRLMRQVKAIGCFRITPMTREELIAYCHQHYQYSVELRPIDYKLNVYVANHNHFLWHSKPTQPQYAELLASIPPLNRRSTDTEVLSEQDTEVLSEQDTEVLRACRSGPADSSSPGGSEESAAQKDEIPTLREPRAGASPTATGVGGPSHRTPATRQRPAPAPVTSPAALEPPPAARMPADPPEAQDEATGPQDEYADAIGLLQEVQSLVPEMDLPKEVATHGPEVGWRRLAVKFLSIDLPPEAAGAPILADAIRRAFAGMNSKSWGLVLSKGYRDRFAGSVRLVLAERAAKEEARRPAGSRQFDWPEWTPPAAPSHPGPGTGPGRLPTARAAPPPAACQRLDPADRERISRQLLARLEEAKEAKEENALLECVADPTPEPEPPASGQGRLADFTAGLFAEIEARRAARRG